jgi:hypothetical protein
MALVAVQVVAVVELTPVVVVLEVLELLDKDLLAVMVQTALMLAAVVVLVL